MNVWRAFKDFSADATLTTVNKFTAFDVDDVSGINNKEDPKMLKFNLDSLDGLTLDAKESQLLAFLDNQTQIDYILSFITSNEGVIVESFGDVGVNHIEIENFDTAWSEYIRNLKQIGSCAFASTDKIRFCITLSAKVNGNETKVSIYYYCGFENLGTSTSS
jgi:hypothetical protein